MKKNAPALFLYVYLAFVAGDLIADWSSSFFGNLIFKPLLAGSLLVYLLVSRENKRPASGFAMLGLFLSWIGDCLLIFQERNQLFFIGGLLSFLIAHIFYIAYYIRSSSAQAEKKLPGKGVCLFLIMCYGIGFGFLLNDHLGPLKVPVFAYASVLVLMNCFALLRFGKVDRRSFQLAMAGALLFAVSDGLLAVNKFVTTLPHAGLWIMSTYAAAQYLITQSVFIPTLAKKD